MEKQIKLVINTTNDQANYNVSGEKTGASNSRNYNILSESGQSIGAVNVSISFNSNGIISLEEYSQAITSLVQKIEESFNEFNTISSTQSII